MKTKEQIAKEMTELYSHFMYTTDQKVKEVRKENGEYQLDMQIAARACLIAGCAATVLRNAMVIMNTTRLTDGKSVEELATEMLTISYIFDALSQTYLDDCGLSPDILKEIGRNDYKQAMDHDLQESANMLQRYIDEFNRQHPDAPTNDPNDVLYRDPAKMS